MERHITDRRASEREFSNKVKVILFVMACMVVSWHDYINISYTLSEDGISTFVSRFAEIIHNIERIATVPFFFLISGFLFFRNYQLKDTGRKWKSRFYSIVVPWILWGSLNWLFFACIHYFTGNMFENINFNVSSYCQVVFAHERTIYWYLQTSIFFMLLAPLLYLMLRNWGGGKIPTGFIVLCISLGICTSNILPQYMATGPLGGYLPSRIYNIGYFMLGAYIAIHHKEIVLIKKTKLTIFGVVGSIICSVLVQFLPAKGILLSVFCICVWFAFDLMNFDRDFPWYIDVSFFIYMSHSPVINIIRRIFIRIGGETSAIGALANFIFAPILTLLIVLTVAYILKKYFGKFWRLLNGGRAAS